MWLNGGETDMKHSDFLDKDDFGKVNAIIKIKVPEYQIGEEVSIYFKDTMMIMGVVEKEINTAYECGKASVLSVIDDIKTEIKMQEIKKDKRFIEETWWNSALQKCLEIIDKHISGKDCRDCIEWKTCECGEKGHINGTSKGYSIGECTEFKHISGKEKTDDIR